MFQIPPVSCESANCWLGVTMPLALRSFFPVIFLLAAPVQAQPNLIYILADDLGFGDLGCFGQETLSTPNLDRMAAQGMKFTRHYSGSTVCAPSRCVLLTGLHTGNCSIRGNGEGQLPDDEVTIGHLLSDAGYKTGCVGKWGIGNPPPIDDPKRMGFEHFFGYVNMFHAHNFYPEFLYRDGERVSLRNVTLPEWKKDDRRDGMAKEGTGVAQTKLDYAPDLIADEAIHFIDDNKDGPFFLYFAMNVPHANNEGGRPPQSDGMEVPDYGEFKDRDWPNPEKGFASMIRNIDRDVGRVLDRLKELGIAENTLVIFSSDNGPHQEGQHQMEFFNSNGDLRGMKRDLYDGGVRVPTIAWWPGTISPGTETEHLSGFQDVLPTFVELAGDSVPERCDGISFVPTLLGKADEQKKHEYLYWEFLERGGKRAVLTEDGWKLVQLNVANAEKRVTELFNLGMDTSESNDLSKLEVDRVAEMSALLDSARSR